jgi:hypothetical protein
MHSIGLCEFYELYSFIYIYIYLYLYYNVVLYDDVVYYSFKKWFLYACASAATRAMRASELDLETFLFYF